MTTYLDQTGLERLVANIKADFTTSAQVSTAIDTKVSNKADKANTIAGYGITDAKISNGVITLGSTTITPLTSHQPLDNYYTKTEVDSRVSAIPKFAILVVDALPTSDISNTTIYLLKTGSETNNLYTEYIYVDSKWETLGTQKMDMSDYLTKTDASTTYLGKTAAATSANKLNTNAGSATQPVYFNNGIPVATTYTLGTSVPSGAKFTDTVYTHPLTHPASMITGLASVATSGSYNDLTDKPTIPAPSTVDSELSSSSTNPVQNKVITEALANVEVDTATNSEIDAALTLPEIGVLPENGVIPVNMGGTGATTIAGARTNLGVSATTDFAKVAFSGSYNDLTGTPTIPTTTGDLTNNSGYITSNALNGYVKSVNGTSPDSNGNVSISVSGSNYTLPTASSSTLGGVKIGSNISVSDGTISLAKSNVTSALGYTPATTNNTSFTGTTMVQTLTVSSALNIPGGSIWIE